MNHKLLKNFFAALFIAATLLSATHHHNDLKKHTECLVCSVNINLQNLDTGKSAELLPSLHIYKETPQSPLFKGEEKELHLSYRSRAPPQILFS
jgi:hypothetical protein